MTHVRTNARRGKLETVPVLSLLLLLLLHSPASAAGVELQIQYSAIQTALAEQMFAPDGRHWVRGDLKNRCSFAYIENPVVGGNSEGKLVIRAKFAGRNAANFFGLCLGPGDAFDLNILATPYYQNGSIRLKDIHVDGGRPESFYSGKVREAVRDTLPKKFDYKAADEARKILQREAAGKPFQHELKDFQISQIRVTPEAVILNLEFTLVVK